MTGLVGEGLAGADTEKGQAAGLGVGGEVAAGVGDAIYLVEGVGKVGDAGSIVACRLLVRYRSTLLPPLRGLLLKYSIQWF